MIYRIKSILYADRLNRISDYPDRERPMEALKKATLDS
jgi:hypothetical protein